MSEFIAIRKERKGGNKHIHPTIGLGLPLGEFCFYEPTMKLLNINKETQGVMFFLSKKDKKVRIEIEEKEDDNYHLAGTKRTYSRFTNKSLGVMLSDLFDLDMQSKHFFKLIEVKKGVFEMELVV